MTLAILVFLGFVLAACLAAAIVFRLRWNSDVRRRLHDWAGGQGLRMDRSTPLAFFQVPARLKASAPGTQSRQFFRIRCIVPDGRRKSGCVGIPFFPGRFAPPILVEWDETGPSFEGTA